MNQNIIKKALLLLKFEHKNKKYFGEDPQYQDYAFKELEVTLYNGKINRVSVSKIDQSIDFPGCKTIIQIIKLKRMLYED